MSNITTDTLNQEQFTESELRSTINSKNFINTPVEPSLNLNLPPPPYAPTSPGVSAPMDQLLYQKMLSLESMVSNIHETVIDNSTTCTDVNTQLQEISQQMAKFQREASIRLRKKLTGSPFPRKGSRSSLLDGDFFNPSEVESDNDKDSILDVEVKSSPLGQEFNLDNVEDKEDTEETLRYDRVCSMLENLITDASSVLETKPVLPEDVPLPEDEDEVWFEALTTPSRSGSFDDSLKEKEEKTKAKTQRNSLRRRKTNRKSIRPLSGISTIDDDRLHLLSSTSTPIIIESDELKNQVIKSLNCASDNELVKIEASPRLFITLLYWCFLFTLGTLLLDSSLCNIAGYQVLSLLASVTGEESPALKILNEKQRKRSNTIGSVEEVDQVNQQEKIETPMKAKAPSSRIMQRRMSF